MTLTLPQSSAVSGARKAAIFLMGVGELVSAELLKHLGPDEVRRITAEIAATPAVGSEQVISVFREFEARTVEGRLFAKGGAECAKRMIETAFGPESAQKLLGPAPEAPPPTTDGLLERTDPQRLAMFLHNEHPQTIAVLLSNLAPAKAAALLTSLPAEVQGQVAVRMGALDRVSPEALQKVTEAIGSKLKNNRNLHRPDGARALASLLKHVPASHADALLGVVGEQNEALAASVRDRMFVFEDLLAIDNEGMKALIAHLDRKLLTIALKGTSAKVRSHFTTQMSQRASEMLAEDMDALGPVRVRDVKAAQSEVINALRKLQQEGSVSASGGDEYVE